MASAVVHHHDGVRQEGAAVHVVHLHHVGIPVTDATPVRRVEAGVRRRDVVAAGRREALLPLDPELARRGDLRDRIDRLQDQVGLVPAGLVPEHRIRLGARVDHRADARGLAVEPDPDRGRRR